MTLAELLHELIVATRILANEKILDAFGHVSVRHPHDPQRYFIPRHRAPELAEVSDLVELTLDSEPVRPTEFRLYSEKRDPRRNLQGAARRQCGVPSPRPCGAALLPFRASRSCRCFISPR